MAGKIVGLFADVSNLYYCVSKRFGGRKLDYQKYLKCATNDNQIYRAFAYGAQINSEAIDFIVALRHFGYDPKYKTPKQFHVDTGKKIVRKADWDVGLSMDVVRLIDRLDIVVIGSADSDLCPLVDWIKEKGRMSVVLACGISRDLKDTADQYIEITEELLEEQNNDK